MLIRGEKMYKEFCDIPEFQKWTKIEKINAGWSRDIKYYIKDCDGEEFLLRISDASLYNEKKKEFEMIKKFNTLSFAMSQAIDFGMCNDNKNVYMLLSWVNGENLEDVIGSLTEKEQYELGIQAGKILKEIHSLKVEPCDFPVKDKREKKLMKLKRYEESSVRIENDEEIIDFVKSNIDKVNLLPPVYEHGDFHSGNLLITQDGKIGVIDFNRWECGDRYEEFYKVQSFDVEVSIPFSIGQIDGYFDLNPKEDFWEALAVYSAHASLFSIAWAEKFGEEEVEGMKKRCQRAIRDYDNFKILIPHWYEDNFMKYRNEL